MIDWVFLVQSNDFLEQRIIGGFKTLHEAETFQDKQRTEGYGWFEIIQLQVGAPFGTTLISKKFFSGGKERLEGDLGDLFPPMDLDDEG